MRGWSKALWLFLLAGCLPPGSTQPLRYAQPGAALCQDRRTIERYLDARVGEDPHKALLLLSVNDCWLTGSERAVRRVYKKIRYREMELIQVRLWGSIADYWALSGEMCGRRENCRRALLGIGVGN